MGVADSKIGERNFSRPSETLSDGYSARETERQSQTRLKSPGAVAPVVSEEARGERDRLNADKLTHLATNGARLIVKSKNLRRRSVRIRKIQLMKHSNGKSPNWYVRYWVLSSDGRSWKEKWVSTRTSIKRDAEEVRRKVERQLERETNPQADLSWAEFVDDFLKTKAPRHRAATNRAYRDCLRAFTITAKPTYVRDVSLNMLEAYGNARLAKSVSPNSVNKELRHVRAALHWARITYRTSPPSRTSSFGSIGGIRPSCPRPTL